MARERLRYIGDGYTEDGFIRKRPGMWDQDLTFLFRPMTKEQQHVLARQCARKRNENRDDDEAAARAELRYQAMAVSKCIISWDYVRPDGKAVLVSADAMLGLKPMLFDSVCAIVCGYEPSDVGELPHRQNSRDEADLAVLFGDDAAASVEVHDAKNSEAG